MPLFGSYLKHWRGERGFTLRRMAESLQVDPSYLSRLERGDIASPSDDVLDRLPQVLEKSREEIYLAAGRITPELAEILELGLPFAVESAAAPLVMLQEKLTPQFAELHGRPLHELVSQPDQVTMMHINAAMMHIAELVDAMDQGRINAKQFEHIAEVVRQLKLSVLASGANTETP